VIRIGSVVVSYEKGNETWVLWKVGNFLTGCMTVSFYKGICFVQAVSTSAGDCL